MPTQGIPNITGDQTVHSRAFLDEQRKAQGARAELPARIRRLIEEARNYWEQELRDDQVNATNRFHGRKFGNEKPGRSQAVSTDVRDAVEAIMPSLLRIFLGTDMPVEFKPEGLEDIEVAEQQTDTVNYLVRHDPETFRTHMAVFEDALVRRVGIIKWYRESEEVSSGQTLTGLTRQQIEMIAQDSKVSSVEVVDRRDEDETGLTVEVKRKYTRNRFRFEAVPNEEFGYSPDAKNLDDAACVYHMQNKAQADLIAMGIPKDLVETAAGLTERLHMDELYQARQFSGNDYRTDDPGRGRAMVPVLYTEAYVRVNDGDGPAERRLFRCIGPDYRPVDRKGELVDEMVPFAVLTPRPLAHMIAGLSIDDFLKDLQMIMSQLERGMLDSLSKALDATTFVNQDIVNVEDLNDPAVHKHIRVEGDPNSAVLVQNHAFLGRDVMDVAEWKTRQKEERVGITRASKGLDADSLQSATKMAVAGTLEKAQERIEMIARAFAETGIARFYKGMLHMIVAHQDRPMVIRLRGQYVEVDPRPWHADFDVIPNVALGSGVLADRMTILREIIADQNTLIQNGAPFVNFVTARRARAEAARLAGFMSPDEFYLPWGQQEQQQWQQAQAQAAQQGDEADGNTKLLAQVESQKDSLQHQRETVKLQAEQQKMAMEQQKFAFQQQIEVMKQEIAAMKAETERMKVENDAALKAAEIQVKSDAIDKQTDAALVAEDVKLATAGLKADTDLNKQAMQSADKAEDRRLKDVAEAAKMRQADKENDAGREERATDRDVEREERNKDRKAARKESK